MKYVPGPAFGQFSGSQGNTTAAHNPWGSYVRNRTVPADPASAAQLVQRAAMASLSQAWRALTQPQREAWIALGAGIEKTDPLGQTYNLSGLQAFTSINRVRLTLGEAVISVAPALDTAPSPVPLVLTANGAATPALSLAFNATPFTGTNGIMLSLTAGVSQGIAFQPRSRFKLLFVDGTAPTSPQNLLAAWQARYGGDPINGTRIFAAAVGVSPSRITGPFIRTSTIVVAPG